MNSVYHVPVLTEEVLKYMNLRVGGVYVDLTLGGGGHSWAMLERENNIYMYCFDRDVDSIKQASKRLLKYKNKVEIIHDNYVNFRNILALHKVSKVDGIIMDIGVSNHQISDGRRGFSFMEDGPLDMRMNRKQELSAWNVVNEYPVERLIEIFFKYGEENFSKSIAQNIVNHRETEKIETTRKLANIIERSIHTKVKKEIVKSKARIFQAIRIEVNNELDFLTRTLKDAISALNPGGRLAVISWHSLEDRIVKESFLSEIGECKCPIELPKCMCKPNKRLKVLTKKPVVPTEQEVEVNSNARSAKLRVGERV